MEKVRQVAMFCVGRAVFFGGFAISIVMLSFAFDFALSLRSGAMLTLVMSLILLWFAQTAQNRSPQSTETWILLADDRRPRNDHARKAFCEVMKGVYGFYAYYAVMISIGLFVASLGLDLFGIEVGLD